MSFLTFNFTKNHIFFLLLFVSYFLRNLMNALINYFIKDNFNIVKKHLIEFYFVTSSFLLAIFPFCIERKRAHNHKRLNTDKSNETEVNANNIIELIHSKRSFMNVPKVLKLIILISTFNFIPRVVIFFFYYFDDDDSKFSSFPNLSSVNIFYILTTFLLSRIFLSKYFYRHHFVSLTINIIGFVINIIIDVVRLNKIDNIIFYFTCMLFSISFSSSVISGKFLLNYISPYSLELYLGLVQVVYSIIISIPLCFIEKNEENIFNNFFEILDRYEIILLYIFNMIFTCCYGIFIWIIVNKFSPNDYALSMIFENMIDKFYEYILTPASFTNNLFVSIIQIFIFILLIIGICIHNEIVVINKWGLNEYIKNNISKKGEDDFDQIYSLEGALEDIEIDNERKASEMLINID